MVFEKSEQLFKKIFDKFARINLDNKKFNGTVCHTFKSVTELCLPTEYQFINNAKSTHTTTNTTTHIDKRRKYSINNIKMTTTAAQTATA